MSIIYRRFGARQDLVRIFRHYALNAGLTVARRFNTQAEATIRRLASMPGMGKLYDCDHPVLAGIRFFPVSRFPKYLVFYRPIPDGIEVVRVLHGAREIEAILATEFGLKDDEDQEDE
ncbi:MAG: hypothetical protein ABS60_15825 [Microbacterium sp. SCN 71-17]|uniref:type II toxin-antitoxin system RelE/ParE family toxin n=1 Tax=Microbacterium sp. SCN 71-17 TaxID=1660111 RepID=UPI0008694DD9|nr:type II toxin-antitoxin system RelE/ParE family toxin [Microbacterium sp. SCN 71-17]ODT36440.1 MAG: hypothetical protein ABS60_15825 [Microbacterium sp. SCN 71-17]